MSERKYAWAFSELCDRLNIVIQKIINAPNDEMKIAFKVEAQDIKHDIDLFIQEGVKVDASMIEAIMVLQIVNLSIWTNEDGVREASEEKIMTHPERLKLAETLLKTHKLNSDRASAKKFISSMCNGRVDPKLNYVSGYFNYEF